MSFEGTFEFLCARGHYSQSGCYDIRGYTCGIHGCTEPLQWSNLIDMTNGVDDRYPETMPAPKVDIGWDDVPMEDHYGNKYFIKNPRYEPTAQAQWSPMATDAEIAAANAEIAARFAPYSEPADQYRIFSGTTLMFSSHSEEECNAEYDWLAEGGVKDLSLYPPHSAS